MNLLAIGINHKTAPLKVRERISFTKRQLKEVLEDIKQIRSVGGIVILFTCNRTEIYIDFIEDEEQNTNSLRQITGVLLKNHQFTEDEMKQYFYFLKDPDAFRHLFKVASGLESQVLGEIQILGQVKSAWRVSKDLGTISSHLDALFEKAVETGKMVRMETKISRGNVSIGSAAVRKLEQRFKDLRNKLILIIGAGKTGVLVTKYLKERGARAIFVSNRTYEKAKELALDCDGEAINFSQIKKRLETVDVIITSTASPHLVLRKEILSKIMRTRIKPLLIMDLALPRDVDPRARNISNISLYDLDDLKSVVEENFAKRKEEARLAEPIIERELENFWSGNKREILCEEKEFLKLVPGQVL